MLAVIALAIGKTCRLFSRLFDGKVRVNSPGDGAFDNLRAMLE
jgi:hypothetical protein